MEQVAEKWRKVGKIPGKPVHASAICTAFHAATNGLNTCEKLVWVKFFTKSMIIRIL